MDDGRPNSTGNGDEPALRELAARLLAPPYPSDLPAAKSEKPELFVGHLPDNLPVEVPIPDGATVVGSAVHKPPRGGRFVEIVLDAAPPAERFRDAYRRHLLAAGWSEEDDWPVSRGFAPRGLPLFFRLARRFPRLRRRFRLNRQEIPPIFRLGARDPKLTFMAADRPGAPSDARISLLVAQREPWLHSDIAWTIIPRLSSPPDVTGRPEVARTNVLHPPPDATGKPWGGGNPYEPDGAYSYATLRVGLDLAALADHYTAQLEDAGWTRTDGGQSGPQAWSAWTLSDEKGRPWAGTLTALRLSRTPEEAPVRYLLQIHANLASDP